MCACVEAKVATACAARATATDLLATKGDAALQMALPKQAGTLGGSALACIQLVFVRSVHEGMHMQENHFMHSPRNRAIWHSMWMDAEPGRTHLA